MAAEDNADYEVAVITSVYSAVVVGFWFFYRAAC